MGAGISLTGGIVSVEDLQRHERSPITMGANFTYRSVFEKGLGREVLLFEPEAATPEDEATPMAGGDTVEAVVGGDNAEGFTEAAARLMAAKPLELVTGTRGLGLLAVLGGESDAVDVIEEQLCELGKRCSGQNF